MNETAPPSILIVDDEPTVRDVLQRWLELAGYRTEQAEHSRAALEMMAACQPAVVICDLKPGDHGHRLVSQLRDKCPDVVVIFCTHVNDVRPVFSVHGGAVSHLVKPFRQVQVLAAAAAALAWRQAALARPTDLVC